MATARHDHECRPAARWHDSRGRRSLRSRGLRPTRCMLPSFTLRFARAQTWTTLASQLGSRGYHSMALLLPNGTVISAGSDSGDQYQTYAEIYSPPYLFKGPAGYYVRAGNDWLWANLHCVDVSPVAIGSVALIRLDAPDACESHGSENAQSVLYIWERKCADHRAGKRELCASGPLHGVPR